MQANRGKIDWIEELDGRESCSSEGLYLFSGVVALLRGNEHECK
jgi:hypothetical protein